MPKFLCRPDQSHYCIECCSGARRNCPLLGDTERGKRGCLGHGGKVVDGMIQTPFCQDFDCLAGIGDDKRKEIAALVSQLPSGEFRISEVKKGVGL